MRPLVTAVDAPPPAEHWHEIAREWYESLTISGQAQFFEPSDWAAARYLAHEMTRALKRKFSSMALAAIWSAMSDLLTTEADRRRVRMEIERVQAGGDAEPASVTAISAYRERIGA